MIFLHKPTNKNLNIIFKEFNARGNYFIFDPFSFINKKQINKYFDINKYYSLKYE